MNCIKLIFKILSFTTLITANLFAQKSIPEKIDSVNSIPYDYIVSNVRESINIFTDNLNKSEEANYAKGIAYSNVNLGLAYYIGGEYEKSASAYLTAINKFEELNLIKELASTLGEYGYQLKQRDLKKANFYMKEGISISEANKFDTTLSKLYDNYGVLKEMENNLDSAMYFYKKSLNIKLTQNDSIGIPYSLNKIVGIYGIQGNYDKALSIMKQSDSYRQKEKGEFGRIENLVLYGDIYKASGETAKAVEYFETALSKSVREDMSYLIRYCYQQLTELYSSLGKYKEALNALNSYTSYQDSVLNKEVQLKVAELEIDYETEKKDRQIAENNLAISEKNSQLYLLVAAIAIILFISFVIFVYQKRKREQLVLNNKLRQAALENKLSEEKLRISRDLHDNIGSQLTFMVSSIDNYVYQTKEKPDLLNNISEFGRDALKELRNTIWALKHEDADVSELILKIKELVQRINSTLQNVQLFVNNSIEEKLPLSAVQILNIYRITQEAIQNSVKHSGATMINIEFSKSGNTLSFSITDNGKGFDITKVELGNGLESMEKRGKDSGGNLIITSTEKGTKIECAININ